MHQSITRPGPVPQRETGSERQPARMALSGTPATTVAATQPGAPGIPVAFRSVDGVTRTDTPTPGSTGTRARAKSVTDTAAATLRITVPGTPAQRITGTPADSGRTTVGRGVVQRRARTLTHLHRPTDRTARNQRIPQRVRTDPGMTEARTASKRIAGTAVPTNGRTIPLSQPLNVAVTGAATHGVAGAGTRPQDVRMTCARHMQRHRAGRIQNEQIAFGHKAHTSGPAARPDTAAGDPHAHYGTIDRRSTDIALPGRTPSISAARRVPEALHGRRHAGEPTGLVHHQGIISTDGPAQSDVAVVVGDTGTVTRPDGIPLSTETSRSRRRTAAVARTLGRTDAGMRDPGAAGANALTTGITTGAVVHGIPTARARVDGRTLFPAK